MSSLCGFPECHDMTLWNMTSRYLLLFSRLMILKTVDSRLINTYFLNKEWFLWPSFMLSCSYVDHVAQILKIKIHSHSWNKRNFIDSTLIFLIQYAVLVLKLSVWWLKANMRFLTIFLCASGKYKYLSSLQKCFII